MNQTTIAHNRIMTTVLSTVITATVIFSSTAAFGVTIFISTIEDLQKIQTDPTYPMDGSYELTQNIDAAGTSSWNAGAGFIPIGTSAVPFTGIFNGMGYKISGLTINRPTTDNVGLFGYVSGTVSIVNLHIDGGSVQGQNKVGALAGYCTGNVVISGCSSTADVTANGSAGGLVGENYDGNLLLCHASGAISSNGSAGGLVGANNNTGSIARCYATGSVSGGISVGGLVGYAEGPIERSYASGAVSGTTNTGGLVGYSNEAGISRCFASGSVSGGTSAGGLIGMLRLQTLSIGYATGEVTGTTDTGGLVGKIFNGTVNASYWDIETTGQAVSAGSDASYGKTAGEMQQQATFDGWDFTTDWIIEENMISPWLRQLTVVIDSLVNLQKIGQDVAYPLNGRYLLQNSINASSTTGWNSGQGFVPIGSLPRPFKGYFCGRGHDIVALYINRSSTDDVGLFGFVDKNATITRLGVVRATITGRNRVGALAGRMYESRVDYCHSTGVVNGTGTVGGLIGDVENDGKVTRSHSNVAVTASSYAGGLVGFIQGTLSECHAFGSVSGIDYLGGITGQLYVGTLQNCHATVTVQGNNYIGGLIGFNWQGEVHSCYAAGPLTASGTTGGLVADRFGGNVTDSYWDREVTGADTSSGSADEYGKTTAEMKQEATFANWDFAADWVLANDMIYPWLRATTQYISTLTELHIMAALPGYPSSGSYLLNNDIDASETEDWFLGEGFESVGSEYKPFSGMFCGQGHVISNLHINRPTFNQMGLFGYVGFPAVISHVRLEGGVINAGAEVGGLVGYMKQGTLYRCSTNMTLSGTAQIGGLVGSAEQSIIRECFSEGDISGDQVVGGLVGEPIISTELNLCFSIATVSGDSNIGGIAGSLNGSVLQESYAAGSVSGNSSSGGLVGYDKGGNVVASLWDRETTGQTESAGSDSTYGKTTAEMQHYATYVAEAWDFCQSWGIQEEAGYPFLLWGTAPVVRPVLTIDSPASVTVECNEAFVLPDALATDACGQSLTVEIASMSGLNPDVPTVGDYVVVYRAEDQWGGITEEELQVLVRDSLAPEIVLQGDEVMMVDCGMEFIDPGYSATDMCFGDLAAGVVVVGGDVVDVWKPGTYTVTYDISDEAGNAAITRIRTVLIEGICPPEGEGEPPVEGEGEPPVEGEGEPPVEGEGEPPVEGEGEPPVEGEGERPVEGEGEPPVEGEGEPPVEGEGEPPVEGEGEPSVEGEGEAPPQIPAPILRDPIDQVAIYGDTLQLRWYLVDEAEGYRVQVSHNPDFTMLVMNRQTSDTSIAFNDLAQDCRLYYWRVRIEQESGAIGLWSSTGIFMSAHEDCLPVEGEEPAEGEDTEEGGCGCGGCKRNEMDADGVKRLMGDWLLVGLSIAVLLALTTSRKALV